MGYNKNNKGNQKKKQNNNGYFQQNIQRDGEDFLQKKTANDIKRDYKRILRDIAFNPSDVHKFAQFFTDRSFVMNLYAASESEMMTWWCMFIGLSNYQQMMFQAQQPIDPRCNIDQNIVKIRQTYEAYSLIIQQLNNVLNYINSGYDIEWQRANIAGCLEAMASSLSRYRHLI